MYNINSNTVIFFSTLLYLPCLYDTAVSVMSWSFDRIKVTINVKNVSHNRLFWHFGLDLMTNKFLTSDIIEFSTFFFWLLYCI